MEAKTIKKMIFSGMAVCILAAGAHTVAATAASTGSKDSRAEMQAKMEAEQTERMDKTFDLLVSFGVLDSDEQAAKVREYFTAMQEKRKAVMDAAKDMTAAERKAYFEANAGTQENLTDALVTDGVITAEQAKTLSLFLGGAPRNKDASTDKPSEETMQAEKQEQLALLVAKGILSESQAQAVLNLKPEIREYGIYTDLVENGTLDADQATLLLSMHGGGHGGFGGPGGDRPGFDNRR